MQWFKWCWSIRFQYVCVISDFFPITKIVPHGPIFGPLLFLIFFNNFHNSNSLFKFILAAEDSSLSCKLNSSHSTEISFESTNELEKVKHLLSSNKIFVNLSKSHSIYLFYHKHFHSLLIKLGSDYISTSDSKNFLGIFLDKQLTFQYHIDLVCSKIAKQTVYFIA